MMWLAVRMDVKNQGNSERNLERKQYVVEAAGETHEFVHMDMEYKLSEKVAAPGETVTGWVFFHVPTNSTEVTLTAVQDHLAEPFTVTFTHDSSLDATLPS